MEIYQEERLAGRRWVIVALNAGSWALLGLAMARLLGAGGWGWAQAVILLLFLVGLPWTLMGFWNSVVGFLILKLVRDPARYTNPVLGRVSDSQPITLDTAICIAVRHEEVGRVFARLESMVESLRATGAAERFAFHLLSDSARPDIVAAEEAAFAALTARYQQAGLLHYRRRPSNEGFKAGNLREFAERNAGRYDLMLVLDADSLMSGPAMLRLVRVMQAEPRLGILQSLVVGRPAQSGFARIFQFGMRHGMRTHTTGLAWWAGPAGPYWGHNAILRLAPFVAHCDLPTLPGRPPLGGVVLSHDQVEAVLMQAAGYEVRVIADEFESWEENPPSLPDFIKRDLRWCQGNMQYLKLILRPGLTPLGRLQLVNAVMMYMGAPSWMLMLAAGLAAALIGHPAAGSGSAPPALAFALYFGMMAIGFAPRFLGVIEMLTSAAGRRRYGGATRLVAGAVIDALFTLLIGPLVMIAQARFVAGLVFGKRILWEAQNRDGHAVPLSEAAGGMAPQMLFGALFAAALLATAPGALVWAAPTLAACLLAIPFTCWTAAPHFGAWMRRAEICAVPDEIVPAPILTRLAEAGPAKSRRPAFARGLAAAMAAPRYEHGAD
jgi:membrane glycosyltransferase